MKNPTAAALYLMSQRRHNTFVAAIVHGAEVCGSQNALAKAIGTNSGNLANAKAGRCVLSMAQLDRLAKLIGDDPGHLWTLMQLHRLQHRNPFSH